MRTVPLHGKKAAGRVALVDDEDYGLVMRYRWHAWFDRHRGPEVGPIYAMANIRRNGRRTTTRMHQVITGWPLTDHIDRNGLNNQRSNLRPATERQNGLNSGPVQHSSAFKGVRWHKLARRWHAKIRAHGVTYELGFYRNEIEAAYAYDAAAREFFGEFAYLNFPDIQMRPQRSRRFRRHPEVSDEAIIALRASGLGWKRIATQVGMSGTGVRMRWHIAVNGERPDRPR